MAVSGQVRLNHGKSVDDMQPSFVKQKREGHIKLVANDGAESR